MKATVDIRNLPAYSVTEAAGYLSLPAATVRYWSAGRGSYVPLIDAPDGTPLLLSFLNLVELHVVSAIRRTHRVAMPRLRAAIDFLGDKLGSDRPLLEHDLETDGVDLFVEESGRLINVSKHGQYALRETLQSALKRISRDDHGVPIKLYPYTRSGMDGPSWVVIDPRVSGGRPVVESAGVAIDVIAERYKAGDSVHDLAEDYLCEPDQIEEAIRCELRVAA